jgi:prophage antirepressor-like protein
MNAIKTYNFSKNELTVELVNGTIWFKAQDLAKILEYSKTEKMLNLLDDDEKLLLQFGGTGQKRDTWFLNEAGLYNVIIKSSKSEVKPFRKWVTHEVLPSIRKAGSYSTEKEKNFNETLYEMNTILYNLKEEKELYQKKLNDLRKQIDEKTAEMIIFIKKDQTQLLLEFPNLD